MISTCSTKNVEYVRSLGADYVIDYTKENILDRVKEITQGKGVDYVYDTGTVQYLYHIGIIILLISSSSSSNISIL